MMFFPLQQGLGNPPNPQADAAAAGITMAIMAFYVVFLFVLIIVQILLLLSLSNCLQQVSPRNRKMEPGQVWLNLIPIFNYVWLILTILRVAESLENEYEDREIRSDGDYGKTLGIIFYVSMFVCVCVTPVLQIMYWMKISGYTKSLAESGGRRNRREAGDED